MSAKFPDIKKVRQLIPPLSNAMHKGQAGKSDIPEVPLEILNA